jgi:DNA segregation ATPase FtsK/SpoIIIE, S-DNA-T family
LATLQWYILMFNSPSVDPAVQQAWASQEEGTILPHTVYQTWDDLEVASESQWKAGKAGGVLGHTVYILIAKSLGDLAFVVVLVFWWLASFILATNFSSSDVAEQIRNIRHSLQVRREAQEARREVKQLPPEPVPAVAVAAAVGAAGAVTTAPEPAPARFTRGAPAAPAASTEAPAGVRAPRESVTASFRSTTPQEDQEVATAPGEQVAERAPVAEEGEAVKSRFGLGRRLIGGRVSTDKAEAVEGRTEAPAEPAAEQKSRFNLLGRRRTEPEAPADTAAAEPGASTSPAATSEAPAEKQSRFSIANRLPGRRPAAENGDGAATPAAEEGEAAKTGRMAAFGRFGRRSATEEPASEGEKSAEDTKAPSRFGFGRRSATPESQAEGEKAAPPSTDGEQTTGRRLPFGRRKPEAAEASTPSNGETSEVTAETAKPGRFGGLGRFMPGRASGAGDEATTTATPTPPSTLPAPSLDETQVTEATSSVTVGQQRPGSMFARRPATEETGPTRSATGEETPAEKPGSTFGRRPAQADAGAGETGAARPFGAGRQPAADDSGRMRPGMFRRPSGEAEPQPPSPSLDVTQPTQATGQMSSVSMPDEVKSEVEAPAPPSQRFGSMFRAPAADAEAPATSPEENAIPSDSDEAPPARPTRRFSGTFSSDDGETAAPPRTFGTSAPPALPTEDDEDDELSSAAPAQPTGRFGSTFNRSGEGAAPAPPRTFGASTPPAFPMDDDDEDDDEVSAATDDLPAAPARPTGRFGSTFNRSGEGEAPAPPRTFGVNSPPALPDDEDEDDSDTDDTFATEEIAPARPTGRFGNISGSGEEAPAPPRTFGASTPPPSLPSDEAEEEGLPAAVPAQPTGRFGSMFNRSGDGEMPPVPPRTFGASTPPAFSTDNEDEDEDDEISTPAPAVPVSRFGGAGSSFRPSAQVEDEDDDEGEEAKPNLLVPPAAAFGGAAIGAAAALTLGGRETPAETPAAIPEPALASVERRTVPTPPQTSEDADTAFPANTAPVGRPPGEERLREVVRNRGRLEEPEEAPVRSTRPTPSQVPQPEGVTQVTNAPRFQWERPDFMKLLEPGSEQDVDQHFLLEQARIIEDTLASFGAPGKVVEVNSGPVITQFGIEPDYMEKRGGRTRVKVSAIAALDKDLALALAAKTIRIEAPVPGKGFVGIEVPNAEPSVVSLRDVMSGEEHEKVVRKSPVAIGLGQSVDGTPVSADLTMMPHLLIAGTTGSGKSVCVNAIIACLLLQNTPDDLQMIMVDPKRVELTGYNGIPHLISNVVVDLERIIGVLKWVQREMDERYRKLGERSSRNIEDYNRKRPEGTPKMPYLVVVIDELADLMMLAPDETEKLIARLAQMARATGIHLIISTQRPSVDVVTGLIKANFPARIAFAVASGVDSRVILDTPGAERLLGKGDMLYQSPDASAPLRLQGVYVSDSELDRITRYWKEQAVMSKRGGTPTLPKPHDTSEPTLEMPVGRSERFNVGTSTLTPRPAATTPTNQQSFWAQVDALSEEADDDDGDDEVDDAMYEEAIKVVKSLNKASASLLQRRLRIGYTRAARLIDLMEERGVISGAESTSKPRRVIGGEDE